MTKIPAVIAMIVKDTGAVWKEGRPNDARALTTRALPWGAAHSGHFWPTEASRLHSTQIDLPQVVQLNPVMRSGWR
jgi:hypothetical protein